MKEDKAREVSELLSVIDHCEKALSGLSKGYKDEKALSGLSKGYKDEFLLTYGCDTILHLNEQDVDVLITHFAKEKEAAVNKLENDY